MANDGEALGQDEDEADDPIRGPANRGKRLQPTPQLVAAHQEEGNHAQDRARPDIIGAQPREHRERGAANRQTWHGGTHKARQSGTHCRPRSPRRREATEASASDACLGSKITLPVRPTAQPGSLISEIDTVTRNKSLAKADDPSAQLSEGAAKPPRRITCPR